MLGDEINIKVDGAAKPRSVLLRGVEGVIEVNGGAAAADPFGVRVVTTAVTGLVSITLS